MKTMILILSCCWGLAQGSCYPKRPTCPAPGALKDTSLHFSGVYQKDQRLWNIWGATDDLSTPYIWEIEVFLVSRGPYGREINLQDSIANSQSLLRSVSSQWPVAVCDDTTHLWVCYYTTYSSNSLVFLGSNGQKWQQSF